jgi:hypothetical protein
MNVALPPGFTDSFQGCLFTNGPEVEVDSARVCCPASSVNVPTTVQAELDEAIGHETPFRLDDVAP